jgi:dTDP-4-dehydrorhamnose reductase
MTLIIKNVNGIYHTAGGECISRYDFAFMVADVFDLDKDLIKDAKMKDMNWIAKRPYDSSLDVSKIYEIKKPYKLSESLNILKKAMEITI